MVYNSNTSLQNQGTGYTKSLAMADADRQKHSDAFPLGNNVAYKNRLMEKTLNNTLDPYTDVYLMNRRPGYSVAYGPGENPADRERGIGVLGGFQQVMRDKYQAQTGVIKVADPLGRSTGTFKMGAGGLGGEFSLMQLQQTMGELKNRAAIESTAAYNRNLPPAARVQRLDPPEMTMEKLLPGIMNDSRTQIIKSTMLTANLLENPYMNSSAKGIYYNIERRSWERQKGPIDYSKIGPPELIEDVIEENMLWKQNMYHGPDYKEGGSTKDKTKETIKTIKNTGELVTTNIGDTAFKNTKEFDAAETTGAQKQQSLKEKMDQKKRAGFLLGAVK